MAEESSAVSAPPPAGIHNRLGRRVKLSEQQLENISRDELLRNWRELDSYVDILETQAASQEGSSVSSLLLPNLAHHLVGVG